MNETTCSFKNQAIIAVLQFRQSAGPQFDIRLEKGTRPDPAEYLSPDYIQHHIEQFNQGATRFMLDESLSKYGIGQRDGTTFVFPTSEVDSLIAKGNFSDVESALGLPEGYFKDFHVIRVDIPHPEDYHLRMPSGERGRRERLLDSRGTPA